MFRFESIPTNNECCVPLVVHKRRERKKLTKDWIPFGLKLFFGAKNLHASLPVNSLLGTFTSGQTNACGVRHVPYLTSLRHTMFFTDDSNDKNEISLFRLRMYFCFPFSRDTSNITRHTFKFITYRRGMQRSSCLEYIAK